MDLLGSGSDFHRVILVQALLTLSEKSVASISYPLDCFVAHNLSGNASQLCPQLSVSRSDKPINQPGGGIRHDSSPTRGRMIYSSLQNNSLFTTRQSLSMFCYKLPPEPQETAILKSDCLWARSAMVSNTRLPDTKLPLDAQFAVGNKAPAPPR